jgi:hypothetical protein
MGYWLANIMLIKSREVEMREKYNTRRTNENAYKIFGQKTSFNLGMGE